MRTKELKPRTRYATENGSLVVTGEVVERGWYSWRESGGGIEKFGQRLPGGEGQPSRDPWSRGKKAEKPLGLRDVKEGILVTWHQIGRDGEPADEEGVKQVIDPKYIKGTWADYLALHRDRIESKFKVKDGEAAAKEESKRLAKLARKAGYGDSSVYVRPMFTLPKANNETYETTYPDRDKTILRWRLAVPFEVKDANAVRLLESIAEGKR